MPLKCPNAAQRQRLRRLVAERDGWHCCYCGTPLGSKQGHTPATLDHVVPQSKGGTWSVSNLVLACRHCNSERGTTPADEYRRFGAPLDKSSRSQS